MATDSDLQSSEGVRTYRGRTLEEILPQIREELGPDAIILREREGLVGGVGGFFAQRFIEVEARRGGEADVGDVGGEFGSAGAQRASGSAIDIYDEDEDEDQAGLAPSRASGPSGGEQALLAAGEPNGAPRHEPDPIEPSREISARRVTPAGEPARPSEPKPFLPLELQRERIIPRDPQDEPAPPTRRFETDIFLERLREASQDLPAADGPELEQMPMPDPTGDQSSTLEPVEREPTVDPRGPARRTTPVRKPRSPQPRRPRPAPSSKAAPKDTTTPEPAVEPKPRATGVDPWTVAMAALVAEPEQDTPSPSPISPSRTSRSPYEQLRQRPPSLRAGLPTESPPAPAGARVAPGAGSTLGAAPAPRVGVAPGTGLTQGAAPAPIPGTTPVAPLQIRGRRESGLRGLISRLLGGRLGASTLPAPSPPHPIDAAAARAILRGLADRGASQPWTVQLIDSAGAHGTALSGGLLAAAEAELARRIVSAPSLPATGAAIAFIGAGGAGKTRCTAALASAYSRASTLGVTVIAIDDAAGARELKRLLGDDGVPVLSLSAERAAQAVTAYRSGGLVILDTPGTTPTDAAAVEALGASLAPLELDATFVTLPATLGAQAARRALASFGRLQPSAVAITHADETDQLAVVVEIAISHRIPLAYLHAGTDHRSAISAIDPGALARQLLAS